MNANKKNLGADDITDIIHGLIDNKVRIFAYVLEKSDQFFRYSSGQLNPSRTGSYQVADNQAFLSALTEHLEEGSYFGFPPGELLDQAGDRFVVFGPGFDLFTDKNEPAAISFNRDSFEAEWLDQPVKRGRRKRDSRLASFIRLFREDHKVGGIDQFKLWAEQHPDCDLLPDPTKKQKTPKWVLWRYPGCGDKPKKWALKTISNKL